MALPSRVQADLDQAEALLAQINSPQAPPAQDDTAAAPAAPVVTDDNPPAAPAAAGDSAAPEPAQTPAPVTTPTSPAAPVTPEATWEQRYRTLQGMHRVNTDQFRQRESLAQQEIDALKRQLEAAQQPTQPPAPVTADTAKDAEVFGTDLVEMVKRTVHSVFGGLAQQFDARLKQLEQGIQGTAQAGAQVADEVFLNRLAALVPDYAQVNESQDFLDWLADVDPVYGVPRQAALTHASQARDASRVAAVFNAFKASLAPTQAPQAPASTLDRQVAPRASASAPAAPSTKPTYSAREVEAFYVDVRRGVYRGREAEAERIEAAFNDALAEGRIRP